VEKVKIKLNIIEKKLMKNYFKCESRVEIADKQAISVS